MTTKIQGAPHAAAGPPADDASRRHHEVVKVAEQFEAVFLRQILSSANIGGKGAMNGFATDALADHLSSHGGIGLSQQIARALEVLNHRAVADNKPPQASPDASVPKK